jgi:hypothetical protein
MMAHPGEGWIMAAEAAGMLGCTPDHVRHLGKRGILMFHQPGGFHHDMFFRREEVERYARTVLARRQRAIAAGKQLRTWGDCFLSAREAGAAARRSSSRTRRAGTAHPSR